ncbi:MAG TPA: hypothetical protein VGO64_07550, partial [Candidatus Limnocylindrales bacterium]|nr:hypothetical protein [Candidatus Limnocylindrales bacterium]
KLSIAYSVVAPTDGSCGDDGLVDVGVYVRTRDLPSGDWSSPERIGAVADHLQSFRLSGGTIHATVANDKDQHTWYETVKGATAKRFAIGAAAGPVALRVGDDGNARIAFETPKGIAFGTFDGASFATTTVPSSARGWNPVFALASGNVANVMWNSSAHGAGCAEPGPDPDDGTWFATNSGGTWQPTKLSDRVGAASITIDPATGEIHALVDDFRALVHFRKPVGEDWTKELLDTTNASSGILRVDPVTGRLVVAYVSMRVDGDDIVMVMSKG